jgi:hypothetical protein
VLCPARPDPDYVDGCGEEPRGDCIRTSSDGYCNNGDETARLGLQVLLPPAWRA